MSPSSLRASRAARRLWAWWGPEPEGQRGSLLGPHVISAPEPLRSGYAHAALKSLRPFGGDREADVALSATSLTPLPRKSARGRPGPQNSAVSVPMTQTLFH